MALPHAISIDPAGEAFGRTGYSRPRSVNAIEQSISGSRTLWRSFGPGAFLTTAQRRWGAADLEQLRDALAERLRGVGVARGDRVGVACSDPALYFAAVAAT